MISGREFMGLDYINREMSASPEEFQAIVPNIIARNECVLVGCAPNA